MKIIKVITIFLLSIILEGCVVSPMYPIRPYHGHHHFYHPHHYRHY